MKILLITDEIWNDLVFGNNVLQNWFDGMPDVEFAQICATPGRPNNRCCFRYFRITDIDMLKSLVGKRAGKAFTITADEMARDTRNVNYIAASPFYTFMKRIAGNGLKLMREMLWKIGRYDKKELKRFIEEFKPDVVFCPRLLSWKLMRLEKIVARYTDAPFIAFTGDDEASFREVSYSPIYWINRFFFHNSLKKHASLYSHYFMHSADQAREYSTEYGVSTSTLFKCGVFSEARPDKPVGSPIRMVYAGRLYCNRWKSLAEIGKALRSINADGVKMILDIYTQGTLSEKQKRALTEDNFIYLKGSVKPAELREVYRKADIALHVESLDKKFRLATRVSFSTKIIDLMASTCAIVAVCWNQHTGYKYLIDNDAALCIADYDEILPTLRKICDNPSLIQEYGQKAYECGKRNHSKAQIQSRILGAFTQAINDKSKQYASE